MSEEDWARLERLVRSASAQTPTLARAYGLTISRLLNRSEAASPELEKPTEILDWMDWERRKILRLIAFKP